LHNSQNDVLQDKTMWLKGKQSYCLFFDPGVIFQIVGLVRKEK
jgi:hypothetical protein